MGLQYLVTKHGKSCQAVGLSGLQMGKSELKLWQMEDSTT